MEACVSQGSPEKQPVRKICCEELADTVMEVAVPKLCRVSQQAGGPLVLFLSEPKGLKTRRADGVVLVQRLVASRPRKNQCFESKGRKRADIPVQTLSGKKNSCSVQAFN